jgi:hypothetical protein
MTDEGNMLSSLEAVRSMTTPSCAFSPDPFGADAVYNAKHLARVVLDLAERVSNLEKEAKRNG